MAEKKKFKIIIKPDYCKSCKLRYNNCPTGAIRANEENFKVEINSEDKCIGCLICENICPDFAIEIEEKK